MDETVWEVLGIEPTADERAIKRAYAARLKVTSPEADAAGYMKLRAAYESAKSYASMQHRLASAQETPEVAAEPDAPLIDTMPAAPAVNVHEDSPASRQQQAFTELQTLLAQKEFDSFLQKIQAIKDAQTFATLDQQFHFVGEVACLVQEGDIEDSEWLGRLAALLGAREHENIFPAGTRYWFAYHTLLECYATLRTATARAHADERSDISVTPGYLHVYHVLTAPFDAERLSALTRSQTYHRLAEHILARAKSDPTIVIPSENREWWERTAMTGQHKPVADAQPVAVAAREEDSSKFPFWMVWLILIVLVQAGRACTSASSPEKTRLSPEEIQRYVNSNPLPAPSTAATDTSLKRRLVLCDRETRSAIITHLLIARQNQQSAGPDESSGAQSPEPYLDTTDPVVASLLEKCQASKFFDENGSLRELPPFSDPGLQLRD